MLAFDGVVLGDLATPCEIFGRAQLTSSAPAYEVRVCSARPRVAAGPVALVTRWRLQALGWADTIIVPGMEHPPRGLGETELRALRRALARGTRVASICTGAFGLAQTGALDGLRVTTHWRLAETLKVLHPALAVDANVLYVDHGQVLTSAGAAAGLDLCLHLVRRDFGAQVASRIAREAVMPLARSGGQAQFIEHALPLGEDTSLTSLLAWIEAHLDRPLGLASLAKRAAVSRRTLSRRFHAHVGATPAAWIAHARVNRARLLLESGDRSIDQIASDVGFGSSTVLRQHFSRLVGTSPAAYRRAFRPGPEARERPNRG